MSADIAQNIGRIRTTDIPDCSTVNEPAFGAAISIELPLYDGGLRRNRLALAEAQRRIAEGEFELARDKNVRQVVQSVRGAEG